ncbi:MAG: ComF family protein, partial [Actinomycetota bacterium]
MLESVLELVGPMRCAGCGRRGLALCDRCRGCLRAPENAGTVPKVERVLAAWHYAGAARDLVLALKLRSARHAALPLSLGICSAVCRQGLQAGVATWVPGRAVDIKRRGYDHAELLAREVAGRLGLRLEPLLRRVRAQPDQASLGADERRRNLQGVFGARPTDHSVVVIDDVVTT